MTIPLSQTLVHPLPLAATFAVVALSLALTLLALTLKVGRILHLRYARRAGNILQGKKSGNRTDKDH